MARLDQEEQEKLDSLKAWWNRYGTIITVALAVAVATIGGSRVWDHYQRQQAEQAADLYALLKQVQTGGDLIKIADAAHLLTEGYASSGYAPRAAMIVVKASMDAGDLKRAKTHLQWILDNAKEPEIIDLARLRLASILLDEKNYSAALQQLNSKHNASFDGLYADLKGDVLLASGKIEEARLSYEAAIGALSKQNNYYNIVQMKADALSGAYTANRLLEWDEKDALSAPGGGSIDSDETEGISESVEQNESESMEAVESIETDETPASQGADEVLNEKDTAIDSLEANEEDETAEEAEAVQSDESVKSADDELE